MKSFRALMGLLLPCVLGMASILGLTFPTDTGCTSRCSIEMLGKLQAYMGPIPLGLLLIAIGLITPWYMRRRIRN